MIGYNHCYSNRGLRFHFSRIRTTHTHTKCTHTYRATGTGLPTSLSLLMRPMDPTQSDGSSTRPTITPRGKNPESIYTSKWTWLIWQRLYLSSQYKRNCYHSYRMIYFLLEWRCTCAMACNSSPMFLMILTPSWMPHPTALPPFLPFPLYLCSPFLIPPI